MKKLQITIAGIVGLISALAIGVTAHLAFVFPKTIQVWMEEGRALSVFQKLLVNLSQVASNFGLLLIPLLLVIVISCVIWAVRTGKA